MRVLMVFGDSAMPRSLLQESPSLNHERNNLAAFRRHKNRCYPLPHYYCHPGAATAVTTATAAVSAGADDDRLGLS